MSRYVSFRDFDWLLLIFVLLLCGMGVMEIHSATMHTKFAGAHIKQIYWVVTGVGVMFLMSLVDYQALFSAEIRPDPQRPQRLMVVQDGGPPRGLVINDVLDKGLLPVHPLAGTLAANPLFIGATVHEARPVLILAVAALAPGGESGGTGVKL